MYSSSMGIFTRVTLSAGCVLVCGYAVPHAFVSGQGAEYRAEFEQRKAAVLSAPDADAEAKALQDLGLWFKQSPYGYTLSAASQARTNGVDWSELQPGEPVELRLHAKSDYEPR